MAHITGRRGDRRHERTGQLRGSLEITSSDHGTTGTTVRVQLPLGKEPC
jgi:hypothetical protein